MIPLGARITVFAPRCTFRAGFIRTAYPSIFQRPLCLRNSSIHLSSPSRLSHTRYFSQSHVLRLRKTYFPNKGPKTGPPNDENLFSQLKTSINALPSNVVLWTILGLNGVVYVLWNVAILHAVSCVSISISSWLILAAQSSENDLSMVNSLLRNFTLSWQNWKEGRM